MSQTEFLISSNSKEKASSYLIDIIKQHLSKDEKVLWLVPGGSAVAVAQIVGDSLKGTDCTNLYIAVTDEVYGDVDHNGSSWSQLQRAGLKIDGASLYPVLKNISIEETLKEYNATLSNLIDNTDYKIGLFGIGADGHTAGILPKSMAVDCENIVFGYQSGDIYKMTVTKEVIKLLDEVVVYAVGESKYEALEKLKGEYDINEHPAQILKQAGKLTIFTDQAL